MDMHVHDQTEDEHKADGGLGTAVFFIHPPKLKTEKMASIRSISYEDAVSRLSTTHGFKWIPSSFMNHAKILADDCDGKSCTGKCPESCYCSGYTCRSV